MKTYKSYLQTFIFIFLGLLMFSACEKDDEGAFERTRLFRPVLTAEGLTSERNTIMVNMGDFKDAAYYTVEVSRDTFQTIDYTIQTDTSRFVINEDLIGEELLWNTIYQIRATAHADDPQYDSRVAELGNVRTQRFPTILNVPESHDVIDTAARVTWTTAGAPVTGIRVFGANDVQLSDPLFEERVVTDEERENAEAILGGLDPETEYQVAIYSEDELRGWVNYTTMERDIDPTGPNVIDIRANEDPEAVSNAVSSAPEGAIILVKKGVTYEFPDDNLNKSITIRSAYGFGEQKAVLETSGNWDIEDNANIDHIRFINLELRGEDYTGDYVFNVQRDNVYVGEVLFEDSYLTNFRGIMRIRNTVEVDRYMIHNSVVDTIGGYGIFTTDTDPSDPPTARVNHIELVNSTFNYIDTGIQSRNNSETILIENSTFANFIVNGGRFFRYRGGEGNNNVTGGITIRNSIFGHSWDQSGEGEYGSIQGIGQGLGNTIITVDNVWSTTNFSFSDGTEIPGFPEGNYSGTQEDLWMNPSNNNFNFRDRSFGGRTNAGDPRWRDAL